MSAPHALTEDEVDDILYLARSGDASELRDTLSSILSSRSLPGAEAEEGKKALRPLLQEARTESGNSALHYAAANGHVEALSLLLPHFSLRALISANDSGNTPLHWAALNGNLEAVESIVSRIEEAGKEEPSVAEELTRRAKEEEEAERKKRKAADAQAKAEAPAAAEAAAGGGAAAEKDEAEEEEDTDEIPAKELWDVRNKAGRGPMSEAQLMDREKVVRFLLEKMIRGGAAATAASSNNATSAGGAAKTEDKMEVDEKTA